MVKIKKGQLIPERYITFIINGKIVNEYISASDDITIKSINKTNIAISFQRGKKRNILNSVLTLDIINMRKAGLDTHCKELLSYPTVKFIGQCNNVCKYELLDIPNSLNTYLN